MCRADLPFYSFEGKNPPEPGTRFCCAEQLVVYSSLRSSLDWVWCPTLVSFPTLDRVGLLATVNLVEYRN